MFDLERAVARWRQQLGKGGIKDPAVWDELESHLREIVDEQVREGLGVERAFELAVERIGEVAPLRQEFRRAQRMHLTDSQAVSLKFVLVGLGSIGLAVWAHSALGIQLTWLERGQAAALVALLFLAAWLFRLRVRPLALEAVVNLHAFTPGARETLEQAREEAKRLHHDFIGTEHSLLGVLGTGTAVLRRFGVEAEAVRNEVERLVQRGPPERVAFELPCTPRLKKALALAAAEAKALRHAQIGAEHILLGLLKEGSGVAALALKNLGVPLEALQEEVRRSQKSG